MTLSGRPLRDTRADARLFVGRESERAQIRRALRAGLNCLLVGERGMGKTSLLRAIVHAERRDGDNHIPYVYVRGAGARNEADLLQRALAALEDWPVEPEAATKSTQQLLADLITWREEGASEANVRGEAVVLLDDPPPDTGNALFGTLRDELWSVGIQWLVAVSSDRASALLRPPADAFFEVQVDLSPLADGEAEDLLELRMGPLPVDYLGQAVKIAKGNPRRLLDTAREVDLGSQQWPDLSAAFAARDLALAQMGRPAHMLAVELEALGGASASDDRLLDRMGWSRARVVQVLHQLEQAGLVTRHTDTGGSRSDGGGRPKVIFEMVPALAFARHHAAASEVAK